MVFHNARKAIAYGVMGASGLTAFGGVTLHAVANDAAKDCSPTKTVVTTELGVSNCTKLKTLEEAGKSALALGAVGLTGGTASLVLVLRGQNRPRNQLVRDSPSIGRSLK